MRVEGREKDAAAFVRNLVNRVPLALPVRDRLNQQTTLAEPVAHNKGIRFLFFNKAVMDRLWIRLSCRRRPTSALSVFLRHV